MKSTLKTESVTVREKDLSDLLERLCSSSELRRSGRLRDFLRYIVQRALREDSPQITEQEIGIHVFGRAESYDTGSDNIVRVNASELRKRIAAYYAGEGAGEPILLSLPVRSYVPQFQQRVPTPGEDRLPPPTADSVAGTIASPAFDRTNKILACAAILIVLLAIACAWLSYDRYRLHQQLYSWKHNATLGPFWSKFFESSQPSDIVIADTSFTMVEDLLKKRIPLSDYLNYSYLGQLQSSNLPEDEKNMLRVIVSRNNGSFGDFRAVQRILALDPLSTRVQLVYARDYRPGSIRQDNLILIGSSHSNPWSTLFTDRLNFVVDYDQELNTMEVRNRHPQPGEQALYAASPDRGNSDGYATIAFLPKENGNTNVLLIAGTTSEATEAASEFITSEESLRRLRDLLKMPTLPYFEVLLKTSRLVNTPLSSRILACRLLQDRILP